MSKTKKVIKKTAKKGPVKKPLKKAAKPSPKKKAAKTPSKPIKKSTSGVKTKPVVKKSSSKAAKPVVAKKKAPAKASKSKTTVKISPKSVSKNTKPKKVSAPVKLKKVAPVKKKEVKKTVPKTVGKKPIAKTIKKVEPKKELAKPIASKKIETKAAPAPKKETAAQIEKARKAEELSLKKQEAERKSNEVLAITNTIPVKEKNEISLSKIASISHSITNPVKKTDSYAIKPEKEPNGKFELEFVVHSSAEMLYEFLSTPSGLSEWFCDDLNIRNGIYTFIWDDQLQQARLLKTVDLQLVRFQWVDKTDGSYFEFRIQRDDLTNDISLIITDFAESVGDRESAKLLWHSQIEKLMHVIGSIF
ncbi:START-like domain-containing protein [Aurantibacillus circumpalustris]|uniref:START-like domain-containing protein n=1 Tax=Aurantibacillus circumpalustris TaxID=3036359 RepID=UPI00295A67C0|nr:START-like domain-containing protein [Aurantibacillus circumpalustris]